MPVVSPHSARADPAGTPVSIPLAGPCSQAPGLTLLAAAVLASACTLPGPHSTRGPGTLGPPAPEKHGRGDTAVEGAVETVVLTASAPSLVDAPRARITLEEARRLRSSGGEEEALELLSENARRSALDGAGWSLMATLLEHEGEAEAALRARRAALKLDPTAQRRAELAGHLSRAGRWVEAAKAWSGAVEADPANARSRGRLAVAQYFAGLEVDRSLLPHAPPTLRAIVEEGVPPRARTRRQAPGTGGPLKVGAERRVDSGGLSDAGELSLVVFGNQLTAAWNDLRESSDTGPWRIGVGTSHDFGETWNDQLLRHPNGEPAAFEGDPMTAVDRRTGNRWIGGIQFSSDGGVYVARQRPSGVIDPPVQVADGLVDKCWMAAGPPPGNPNATRVYVAYNFPNSLHRSTDLGATWSSPVAVDESGIGFLPRVAPDGTLYLAYTEYPDFTFETGVMFQTSGDGGQTVGAPRRALDRMDAWDSNDGSRFPGLFRVPPLPILAVSPVDGTLYFAFMDTTAVQGGQADVDLYLSRSTNGGLTWSAPTIIAGGPGVGGDQFMAWLEVDDGGGLHTVFFDSRRTAQNDASDQPGAEAFLDVIYSTSRDGGASWTEVLLTPTPFPTGGVDWPNDQDQFLGDYLGLAVEGDQAWVAYPRVDGMGVDLDVFSRRIEGLGLFEDGFESGTTGAWDSARP